MLLYGMGRGQIKDLERRVFATCFSRENFSNAHFSLKLSKKIQRMCTLCCIWCMLSCLAEQRALGSLEISIKGVHPNPKNPHTTHACNFEGQG